MLDTKRKDLKVWWFVALDDGAHINGTAIIDSVHSGIVWIQAMAKAHIDVDDVVVSNAFGILELDEDGDWVEWYDEDGDDASAYTYAHGKVSKVY